MQRKSISTILLLSIFLFLTTQNEVLAQNKISPYANTTVVLSLYDLPAAQGDAIKLDPSRVYIVSGMVNISPKFIVLNGASIKGNDPSKDGIISNVEGAVLRSYETDILMSNLGIILAGAKTTAYEFVDKSSTKFCNLLAGNSVLDVPNVQSGGVGQILGFNAVYITANYWRTAIGLKLTGKTGKFCSSYNYIVGIASGAAIEFGAEYKASDIDLSNNYFVYSGDVGVNLVAGADIDQGRVSGNLCRGVANLLKGFGSHSPGWEMRLNGAGVPDTRPFGFMYMNDNEPFAQTKFLSTNLYTKIVGATTSSKVDAFIATDNRFTYTGKRPLLVRATVNIGARAPENNSDFSIVVMKNGLTPVAASSSKVTLNKGEGFQINLETIVELIQNDYIEVFLKNNSTATPITVRDLQFKVSN